MRVARPLLRVLLFAVSHLVLALLVFFLALYVTAREFERAVAFSWSDLLFWFSIVLIEPARSIVNYADPPQPLALLIFVINSLAWGYGVAALLALWARMRGGMRQDLPDFAAFWLTVFAPFWGFAGAYLFITRSTRIVRDSAAPGETGVALLGLMLLVSVLGLAWHRRWAYIALITHWMAVVIASVALLILRGINATPIASAVVASTFVALLLTKVSKRGQRLAPGT